MFDNKQIVQVSVREAETFVEEISKIMSELTDDNVEFHQSWVTDATDHIRALLDAIKLLESDT